MNRFVNVNKVCGLSPHAFSCPCIAAEAAIGLGIKGVSAIGNLISGNSNLKFQKQQWKEQREENELNRKFQTSERLAAQEYNSTEAEKAYHRNRESQDIQNKFNSEEAQKARDQDYEYNSMVSQMARARAAGLNPNLVVGNSSTVGSSAASGSASTSPAATSSAMSGNSGLSPVASNINPMESFGEFGTMLQQQSNYDVTNRNVDADSELKEIDAKTRDLLNFNMLQKIKAEAKGSDAKRYVDEVTRDFLDKTFGDRADAVKRENANKLQNTWLQGAQMQMTYQQIAYQRMVNANYPKEFAQRMAALQGQIALSYAQCATEKEKVKVLKAQAIEVMTMAYRNGYGEYGKMDFSRAKKLACAEWNAIVAGADKDWRTPFTYGWTDVTNSNFNVPALGPTGKTESKTHSYTTNKGYDNDPSTHFGH